MAKKKTTKKAEKRFLKEVKEELKKVKWPSKEDMTKYTIATLAFLVIFGLYFYGLDLMFSWIKGITG
ncbi:MAG: preprotein translocase subunit SecE [Bacilli bacterium]|nr:preprotein translocase subunit SecE [Bacilli bacterium]